MALSSGPAQYLRALQKVGELVQFDRNSAGAPTVWVTYATARCRVMDYDFRPSPLAGAVAQDERMMIVLAADMTQAPKIDDRVTVRGKVCTIKEVDESTRRIAGVLLAYEVRIKG